MNKVYQIVTDKVLAKMAEGEIPWRKPWVGGRDDAGLPRNFRSKKAYQGINQLLLSMAPYSCPFWVTYKQAQEAGGQVRQGEKSTLVVFWKPTSYREADDNGDVIERKSLIMRYYNVFNLEQVDGIDWQHLVPQLDPRDASDILDRYSDAPRVIHSESDRAFYRVSDDLVSMPMPQQFPVKDRYYQVLYHELVHSTGHAERLNRAELNKTDSFGGSAYAREELTAEIGSCFLCAETGIEPDIENSAAYLQSWMKRLEEDPELIIKACSRAGKAVRWILGDEEEVGE